MDDIINFLKHEDIDVDPFNDNYTGVEPDDDINEIEGSWVFPPIYKEDSHGNTIKWQIGFSDTTKKLITVTGRLETGHMQIFPVDIIPSKLHKNYHQKAFQEAKTKFENKMREGYKYVTGHSSVEIPQPMLANKYKPPADHRLGNIPHFPVAAQAKFDGIRNLVYIDSEGDVIMLTRKMNKRLYFDKIREECGRLLEFLPKGTILDGELYSERVPFEVIASIGARELVKHPREDDLDYYIFDIFHPETIWKKGMSRNVTTDITDDSVYVRASGYVVEDYTQAQSYFEIDDDPLKTDGECKPVAEILDIPLWTLEIRLQLMVNMFNCYRRKYGAYPENIKLTKTYIIRSRDEIYKIFHEFRNLGQEGAMVRHFARGNPNPLLSLYRPGRSDNLIKVKDKMETEVVIIGVTSGKGKDKELALFIYREPDTGITGTVTPATTHENRRHYLKHPEEAIGKIYTVSFQNRTKDGKMRFPKGIAFRSE